MEKKLQELTEKIYSEGVEKAKTESEKIIADARKKAEETIRKAESEKAAIIAEAEKTASDVKRNAAAEMKLASKNALNEVKQTIADVVNMKLIDKPAADALSDTDFLKKLIEISLKSFDPADPSSFGLEMALPADLKEQLDSYLKNTAAKLINAELKIDFSTDIEKGFKIGPADGSYKISFTDKDFENFFKKYLRPKTMELLFGGDK